MLSGGRLPRDLALLGRLALVGDEQRVDVLGEQHLAVGELDGQRLGHVAAQAHVSHAGAAVGAEAAARGAGGGGDGAADHLFRLARQHVDHDVAGVHADDRPGGAGPRYGADGLGQHHLVDVGAELALVPAPEEQPPLDGHGEPRDDLQDARGRVLDDVARDGEAGRVLGAGQRRLDRLVRLQVVQRDGVVGERHERVGHLYDGELLDRARGELVHLAQEVGGLDDGRGRNRGR